jgi:hypothetical protein
VSGQVTATNDQRLREDIGARTSEPLLNQNVSDQYLDIEQRSPASTFTLVVEHLFDRNSSHTIMIAEIIHYASNHLDTIMTGLTMAVVGIGVYEARDGFFLFNGQFRGKYVALLIFLVALFGASLITPMVGNLWEQLLPYIPPGQLLGTILVLGMLGVNNAAEWNYLDIKSLPVYVLGVVLIVNPELLNVVA